MKNLEKLSKDKWKLDIIGISILVGTTLLASYLMFPEGHIDQIRNYDYKNVLQKAKNVPYHVFF